MSHPAVVLVVAVVATLIPDPATCTQIELRRELPVHARRGSRILVRWAQQSFDPMGDLSPKFAQNRGFSLKLS